ncbi:MAG: DOMON-like domain-containing protein [Steroidobacteraceae bacterium]
MPGFAPRCVALVRHPSTPAPAVRHIDVELGPTPEGGLRLRYFLDGDVAAIAVPPPAEPRRTDGLWQHTCFEAFIGGQGSSAYCEFNFSPSTRWAAYGFSGYRAGMVPLDYSTPPGVAVSITEDRIALEATIPLEALLALPGNGTLLVGLAAVIEDQSGGQSYWALAHRAEKPDFHSPAGFVLQVERDSTW